MPTVTGADKDFSQREDEIIAYTFDFGAACRDGAGDLYDHLVSASAAWTSGGSPALTVTPVAAGAVDPTAIGTTTLQLFVGAGTVGSEYTLRVLTVTALGQRRDLAMTVTITPKAATP